MRRLAGLVLMAAVLAGCGDKMVGAWTPEGETAPVYTFRDDGTMSIGIAGAISIDGTWERVESGMIRMHFEGGVGRVAEHFNPSGNVRVSVNGDRMTLSSGEGDNSQNVTFVRREP